MTDKPLHCAFAERALMVTPTSQFRPCCRFEPGKYGESLEWADSEKSMEQFLDSINFSRLNEWSQSNNCLHPSCSKCDKEEKLGLKSMRQKDFPGQSRNFLEISAGRVCNLKCRSCNANYSTKWDSDYRKMGLAVPESRDLFDLNEIPDRVLRELGAVKITGGEPLLNPALKGFLARLSQLNKSSDLSVELYTNATLVPNIELLETLDSFPKVNIRLSLDAIGEKNTYLRYPAIWSDVVRSVENWWRMKDPSGLSFAITVSVYNFLEIFDILAWVRERNSGFVLQVASDPEYMSVFHMKNSIKSDLKKELEIRKERFLRNLDKPEQFKGAIQKLESLVDGSSFQGHISANRFFEETRRLDLIRNQDFQSVFPELNQILEKHL